jgi:hypothetical protein
MMEQGNRVLLSTDRMPSSRSTEDKPNSLHLAHVEQENPNEVLEEVDTLGKPTVRKAEFLSGRRKDQEAKAASRKTTGKDN